jgi:hypothetical protein
VNALNIIFIVAGVACLIFTIIATGLALERRKARKLASSLFGQPCPFCGSLLGQDAIRSARLDHGFEDDDVRVVCPNCSKTVIQYEKDRAA